MCLYLLLLLLETVPIKKKNLDAAPSTLSLKKNNNNNNNKNSNNILNRTRLQPLIKQIHTGIIVSTQQRGRWKKKHPCMGGTGTLYWRVLRAGVWKWWEGKRKKGEEEKQVPQSYRAGASKDSEGGGEEGEERPW